MDTTQKQELHKCWVTPRSSYCHLHSLINRLQLPVHCERKPEKAPGVSSLFDDIRSVQVECWQSTPFQDKNKRQRVYVQYPPQLHDGNSNGYTNWTLYSKWLHRLLRDYGLVLYTRLLGDVLSAGWWLMAHLKVVQRSSHNPRLSKTTPPTYLGAHKIINIVIG